MGLYYCQVQPFLYGMQLYGVHARGEACGDGTETAAARTHSVQMGQNSV